MNQETKIRNAESKAARRVPTFSTNPASAIILSPRLCPARCRSGGIRRSIRRTDFMPS